MMTIDQVMVLCQTQKAKIVQRDGVGSDVGPMLHLFRDGELVAMVSLQLGRDVLFGVIGLAVSATGADFVIHATEGYRLAHPTEEELAALEVGELARRFGAGDPAVHEELIVTGHTPHGPLQIQRASYRYSGRTVDWYNVESMESPNEGAIPDAVQAGFAAQQGDPLSFEDLMTMLGAAGARAVVIPEPVKMERNQPCPCGSGIKAKKCCGG